jgi:hypothetical protein
MAIGSIIPVPENQTSMSRTRFTYFAANDQLRLVLQSVMQRACTMHTEAALHFWLHTHL